MWDTIGWVISSEPRRIVLEATSEGPITPKEISEKKEVRMEYVSRSLSNLVDKNLVECLNPDAHKGRLYTITNDGEKILSSIDNNGL